MALPIVRLDVVLRERGGPVGSGNQVQVQNIDGSPATLYANSAGSSTLSSTQNTDADGRVPGFLEIGSYQVQRLDGSGGVLTVDGLPLPPQSYEAVSGAEQATEAGGVEPFSGVYNVRGYGAGNGDPEDDQAAIDLAIADATKLVIGHGMLWFPDCPEREDPVTSDPDGGSTYYISKPIPGNLRVEGASRQVRIKALAALGSGPAPHCMIDTNVGNFQYFRGLKNLTLSASNIVGVSIVSSGYQQFGNSVGVYEQVDFQDVHDDTHALSSTIAPDGSAFPGLYLNATFLNCTFQAMPQFGFFWPFCDDLKFQGCRFRMEGVATIAPFWIFGPRNVTFENCWVQLGDIAWSMPYQPGASDPVVPLFWIETDGNVAVRGLDIEKDTDDPYPWTHFFALSSTSYGAPTPEDAVPWSPNKKFSWDGGTVWARDSDLPDFKALVYCGLYDFANDGDTMYPSVSAKHIHKNRYLDRDLSGAVLEVELWPGWHDHPHQIQFDFEGVSEWDLLRFTAASDATAGAPVLLHGLHRGIHYAHTTDKSLVMTPTGGGDEDYVCIQDQKAANTDGGAFTSGAWQTRDLNTEVADTGSNSALASNQITLQPGTYRCRISAPAFAVNEHKARLRNVTDGTTLLVGTSEFAYTGSFTTNRSLIEGRFTLAAAKVLEVQHRGGATQVTNGFGAKTNFGEPEIYTSVELWKEG